VCPEPGNTIDMTIQIVTDSGSDLPQALARRYGITVVPLQVLVGGKTYRDGVDLAPSDFYRKMREARELPKTSQPAPHDLMTAYQAALTKGPVIGVHVSAALSGTFQTATMVARGISDAIQIFNSKTGSGGQSLMAIETAEMARTGAGVTDILQRLEQRRAESRTLVLLHTLENAVRGGRVSPLAGMAANLLGIKPIVTVTPEGTVVPVDKVRGRTRAMERLLEMAAAEGRDLSGRTVAVAHGGCPEEAEAFAARVRERLGPREVLMLEIGATIGAYAAEGALLLSF
jgi:DegV family protein with EDD domain